MNTSRIFLFIAVIAVAALPACISSSNPNPPVAQPPAAATTVSTSIPKVQIEVQSTEAPINLGGPAESSGACNNPYLPIILNATWNYKLTEPVPDTFIHTIASLESNSFVEKDVFGTGVTRQGKWNCDNGNLIALDPPAGSSDALSTGNASVDFHTTEVSGVTLPATINAGDTWSQTLNLEGTQTLNGAAHPASNHLTSDCKAIGLESVTVEAGTFDAMRVECQTTMKLSLKLGDTPTESTLNSTGTNWYVRNIGVVKTLTVGFGFESTVELVSYSIP